jgi:hypothetical protein
LTLIRSANDEGSANGCAAIDRRDQRAPEARDAASAQIWKKHADQLSKGSAPAQRQEFSPNTLLVEVAQRSFHWLSREVLTTDDFIPFQCCRLESWEKQFISHSHRQHLKYMAHVYIILSREILK